MTQAHSLVQSYCVLVAASKKNVGLKGVVWIQELHQSHCGIIKDCFELWIMQSYPNTASN